MFYQKISQLHYWYLGSLILLSMLSYNKCQETILLFKSELEEWVSAFFYAMSEGVWMWKQRMDSKPAGLDCFLLNSCKALWEKIIILKIWQMQEMEHNIQNMTGKVFATILIQPFCLYGNPQWSTKWEKNKQAPLSYQSRWAQEADF